MLVDFAADKAAEAATLADTIAQVAANVADASAQAADALATHIAEGNAELDAAKDAAAAELPTLQGIGSTREAALGNQRQQVRDTRQASYDQAFAFLGQAVAAMADADGEVVVARNESLAVSAQEKAQRETQWQERADQAMAQRLGSVGVAGTSDFLFSVYDCFQGGAAAMMETLPTSLRAIGNAAVDSLANTISAGLVDDLEAFGGEDQPYYNWAYVPARITFEVIITIATRGVGAASKIGKVLRSLDFLSSAVSVGRGGYGMAQEGPTVTNSLQVGTGLFGLGYNAKAVLGDIADFVPTRAPKETALFGAKWGTWRELPKVMRGGRVYANIRGRLYTEHAIQRMIPKSFGNAPGGLAGRGVPPMVVEEVIQHGRIGGIRVVGSTTRVSKILGDVEVILEDGIVISIIRH